MSHSEQNVELYKLSEIFSIVPEFEGDQIFLNTFLNACDHAQRMAVGDQKTLLNLHIKNKLKGKAAQLVNSRNAESWYEIKSLLNAHFGDSRDLTSLIQDLQRIKQLPGESATTFYSRLQTHNSKMHAAVQKSNLSAEQKAAQTNLLDTMTLNTLLTGLEPRLGQLIRASNPSNMLEAYSRIRRELQLSYFENQKVNKNVPNSNSNNNNFNVQRKQNNQNKFCNYCKRNGHVINECRQKQARNVPFASTSYNQNPQRNFSQNNQHSYNNSQNFNNNQHSYNNSQNSNQQRNFQHNNNQNRPQGNQPNFYTRNNNNSQRTHNINSESSQSNDFHFQNPEHNQNFQEPTHLDHPPVSQKWHPEMNDVQSQMSTMTLDDFNPNLNFPEQYLI